MAVPAVSDAEWVAIWEKVGRSPARMSEALGVPVRIIYRRRRSIEKRGTDLTSVPANVGASRISAQISRGYEKRRGIEVANGCIVVFSDAHWWPGRAVTPANAAMFKVIKSLRPVAVIANGDVLDAPQISRHDPDGWQNLPTLVDELDEIKRRMGEIAAVSRGALLLRTIGNHDLRFDRRLATRVPDFKHLAGMRLSDHLPAWSESWAIEINGAVIVKHRWHNGIHGSYNNVLKGSRGTRRW